MIRTAVLPRTRVMGLVMRLIADNSMVWRVELESSRDTGLRLRPSSWMSAAGSRRGFLPTAAGSPPVRPLRLIVVLVRPDHSMLLAQELVAGLRFDIGLTLSCFWAAFDARVSHVVQTGIIRLSRQ